VFAALHHGKEALDAAIEAFGREARLLSAVGAKYLIHLPEQQYTDMHSGEAAGTSSIRRGPTSASTSTTRSATGT
jgi:inosose dehydratase